MGSGEGGYRRGTAAGRGKRQKRKKRANAGGLLSEDLEVPFRVPYVGWGWGVGSEKGFVEGSEDQR